MADDVSRERGLRKFTSPFVVDGPPLRPPIHIRFISPAKAGRREGHQNSREKYAVSRQMAAISRAAGHKGSTYHFSPNQPNFGPWPRRNRHPRFENPVDSDRM